MKTFFDVVMNIASSPGVIGVCMRWPALIPVAVVLVVLCHYYT
jgi:hypothetical protein